MTVMISKEIGHAMAVQVKRVNKNKSAVELAGDLAIALQTIDSLRARIRQLERAPQPVEVFDGSPLSARRGVGGEVPGGEVSSGETLNGRPVLTIAQAAKAARKHYQSAYRRVQSGKWQAVQLSSGDWRVYADQPLT